MCSYHLCFCFILAAIEGNNYRCQCLNCLINKWEKISRYNSNNRTTNTEFLTVCSCHVTYAFQSESTLYSCLNVKELLARSRRKIWSLSECNWTRTHNHLVHKQILSDLPKLAMNFRAWIFVYELSYCGFEYIAVSEFLVAQ